jgi:hypothetical protein
MGELFNTFKSKDIDSKALEVQVVKLMLDEDVTNKKGVYHFVLSGQEGHLNIRTFSPNQKREAFERQKGKCPMRKKSFAHEEMEGDHITPWSDGAKTDSKNCQMLCKEDNRRKSAI